MTTIAVIAHRKKILGEGLGELRKVLAQRGYPEPIWYEVDKSRKAPKAVRSAISDGADLIFAWGGDGTVQRCVDVVAGKNVTMAILPAGTANLLANSLEIPIDIEKAVDVGLYGDRRRLDVGVLNGQRFAVMAGVGFDAVMMQNADGNLKDRFGRLAYVWTGIRATHTKPCKVSIKVDGKKWFKGKSSCVLLGQMGSLPGGFTAFANAVPDDGLLEVGVVTADSMVQWARVFSRLAQGDANRSPLTNMTQGREVEIKMSRSTIYEVDGGAREARKTHRASIEPSALSICVPAPGS